MRWAKLGQIRQLWDRVQQAYLLTKCGKKVRTDEGLLVSLLPLPRVAGGLSAALGRDPSNQQLPASELGKHLPDSINQHQSQIKHSNNRKLTLHNKNV